MDFFINYYMILGIKKACERLGLQKLANDSWSGIFQELDTAATWLCPNNNGLSPNYSFEIGYAKAYGNDLTGLKFVLHFQTSAIGADIFHDPGQLFILMKNFNINDAGLPKTASSLVPVLADGGFMKQKQRKDAKKIYSQDYRPFLSDFCSLAHKWFAFNKGSPKWRAKYMPLMPLVHICCS